MINRGLAFFTSVVGIAVVRVWYKTFHKPKLYYIKSKLLASVVQKCGALHKYEPPLLIDHYGHIHTFLNHLLRLQFAQYHSICREIIALPDGGTVAMDWMPNPPRVDRDVPIVILMHGLCGNSESNHIVYAGHEFLKCGFEVGAFICRGCGGLPLTTPESFTAARTSDITYVLDRLHAAYPNRPLVAVGYSLGAGILLKYLGQHGHNSRLAAAVAVSPSWDFLNKTPYFEMWSSWRLAEGLREYLQAHLQFLSSIPENRIRIAESLSAKNVREFDEHAVVPVHGYDDVDHYYRDASAIYTSQCIVTPTLAISAEDDPVCYHEGCPIEDSQLGPGLVVAKTRVGGHVAFMEGLWFGTTSSWMDTVAIDWIKTCLDNKMAR